MTESSKPNLEGNALPRERTRTEGQATLSAIGDVLHGRHGRGEWGRRSPGQNALAAHPRLPAFGLHGQQHGGDLHAQVAALGTGLRRAAGRGSSGHTGLLATTSVEVPRSSCELQGEGTAKPVELPCARNRQRFERHPRQSGGRPPSSSEQTSAEHRKQVEQALDRIETALAKAIGATPSPQATGLKVDSEAVKPKAA